MSRDILKYHQWCISDPVAISAYRGAIQKTVRRGDIVLDLGAGTGILGYQACAAGAARVYAIEPDEIIALISPLAAENDLADRVIAIKATSFDVELREKVDVLIASMLAPAGIGNNMLKVVLDARERFLKPGGRIVPLAVQPVFCPAELPEWYQTTVDCWSEPRSGFSFRAARAIAVNQCGSCKVDRASLLGAPECLGEIRLSEITSANAAGRIDCKIQRPGVAHGLAGWVQVTMAEGISCSNSPLDSNKMPWDHLVLPLSSPASVEPNDTVDAKISATMVGPAAILTWDVSICSAAGGLKHESHNSTFHSLLLTREDLVAHAYTAVPVLSEAAKVEMAALELCDGSRSLEEIAVELQRLFPGTLRNLREAADFAIACLRGRLLS